MIVQPIAVGGQSALRPAGPAARAIGDLWDVMLVSGTIITVLVLLAFAWALWHRRAPGFTPEADRPADARGEASNDESGGRSREGVGRPRTERQGTGVMVGAGIVFPTIVLGVVLVFTLKALAAISLPSGAVRTADALPAPGELVIKVTGRQYWWQVEYLDREPSKRFETANELRIPVGRTVTVRLVSDDVIHSFWVPELQGKMDLVPGRVNAMALNASRPGVFRGQCAEFCGVQHAKMAFVVVAEPPARYEAWAARQRESARSVRDSAASDDEATFLASGCALCHAVRGTPARGELGPDLTHLATRLTLAAGTLPNRAGHLYGWIANPQAIKPGSKMPATPLSTRDLHAIARYLASLD